MPTNLDSKLDTWLERMRTRYVGLWATLSDNQKDRYRESIKDAIRRDWSFGDWQTLWLEADTNSGYVEWEAAKEAVPFSKDMIGDILAQEHGDFWSSLGTADKNALIDQLWTDAPRKGYEADFANFLEDHVVKTSSYTNWADLWQTEHGTPPPTGPGSGSDPGGGTGNPPPTEGNPQLLAQITALLGQWHLPASLADFIRQEVIASKSFDEIINDLRATSEYQAAFPENAMRLDNGLSTWSEQQILEYRDQAKQIARQTLGIDVSNTEVSNLIAKNKSLSEWASNLNTYASFERWGPAVKAALSQELGYDVSDERAYAFMSPDTPTPELDLAYTKALMRGQPAVLGFGIRPEEEADILLAHGINPDQAFQGYQGIASELPRQQRLAAIDAAIQGANVPDTQTALGGTSYSDLFQAIQLRDPTAILKISQTIAQETARWQSGGGASRSGTVAAGLLTPDERANY